MTNTSPGPTVGKGECAALGAEPFYGQLALPRQGELVGLFTFAEYPLTRFEANIRGTAVEQRQLTRFQSLGKGVLSK